MNALLLDTNIWVSHYLSARCYSENCRSLITEAVKRNVPLVYAVHTSKDFFFVFSKFLKAEYRQMHGGELHESAANAINEMAWSCLENMKDLAVCVGADQTDVWLAMKHKAIHSDYEDDLVIAAAMRSGATLITDDDSLRNHCPVACLSSAEALPYVRAIG